jgi:hypothetical protein
MHSSLIRPTMRGWFNLYSTLAITLTLLGAPLHAQFAYVANSGDNTVSGFGIDPDGTFTAITGSPFSGVLGPVAVTVDPAANSPI